MEGARAIGFPSDQTLNAGTAERGSQSAGDKFRRREGNSPDRQPRPLNRRRVCKDVGTLRQPGCWLRGSHHSKNA